MLTARIFTGLKKFSQHQNLSNLVVNKTKILYYYHRNKGRSRNTAQGHEGLAVTADHPPSDRDAPNRPEPPDQPQAGNHHVRPITADQFDFQARFRAIDQSVHSASRNALDRSRQAGRITRTSSVSGTLRFSAAERTDRLQAGRARASTLERVERFERMRGNRGGEENKVGSEGSWFSLVLF